MADGFRLTKSAVDRIISPENGQSLYWDSELQGFGLRVGAQDRAYIAQGRVNGRTVRFTIGRHGRYTPEEARKHAKAILGDMSKGLDPNEAKAEARARGLTLIKLYEEFKRSRKGLKAKTLYDYGRIMNTCFGGWRNRPVREITPAMIERKHSDIGKNSPALANLAMRFLRAVLNYGAACTMDNGKPLLLSNPAKVLSAKKAWFRIKPRSSYIKPTELADWWKAVDALDNETLRDYLQLVMLTGLRRNEAERLQWANVDLKARTLTVPDTKNHRDHSLPLSDYLLDMLSRRKRAAEKRAKDNDTEQSAYVFSGEGITGHLVEPKRQVGKVTESSGITFTIHDLRRTFASIVNSLDKTLSYYTIKRLLNHHISGDVTANYIQHDVEQLRAGMQAVTDYVLKMAGKKASADVIIAGGKRAQSGK
jgi:integrase